VTRKRVLETLTHLSQSLRNCGQLPKNGLAIFAGFVNGSYWSTSLEPSKRVQSYVYRCGGEFYTAPLEVLEEHTDLVAVIAIDASDCAIGLLDGPDWRILDVLTSGVGGKSGKGGQSARRYERNRERKLIIYYRRAAEHANNLLRTQSRLAKIVITGPGLTKDEFLKKAPLDYRLKRMVTETIGSEYAGVEGVIQTRNILETRAVLHPNN